MNHIGLFMIQVVKGAKFNESIQYTSIPKPTSRCISLVKPCGLKCNWDFRIESCGLMLDNLL